MTTTSRTDLGTSAAVVMATLGLAAISWVFAIQQMRGMDMGIATRLGSLSSFIAMWVPMMAAMMLPGAVSRAARSNRGLLTVPLFVGAYLAVWAVFGVAVYMLYRPHGPLVAGVVVIGAGLYELTPLKQSFRGQCRERVYSGFKFGLYCVGSSIGQMLMMVALGVMSVFWMAMIAILVVAQKLMPARTGIDVPVALAIIGLGILIVISPSSVPGLMPPI